MDPAELAALQERVRVTFELHELGVAMNLQRLRREHPDWPEERIREAHLRWLWEVPPGVPLP